MVQELFEFAAEKLNTEEPKEGKCLHYRTRIKYFENITRGLINESKTIPKTHEIHSIRSVGEENVVQTRNTTCCCLNCVTGIGKCEFFEIASEWEFHSVVGEALRKPKINHKHRKINKNGNLSEEQIQVNNYQMGKLGKPEKAAHKKISKDDEIDFPLEEISPAMYRKKKMEERKRKLPPEDGTNKSKSCRKKLKLIGDDLVRSEQKIKYQKQNDIPYDIGSSGKKKNQDTPEELVECDVREKLHPYKFVQYIEDSSSQHDDTADDSDYYPSSQASQDTLLEMGIKRIESVNKM